MKIYKWAYYQRLRVWRAFDAACFLLEYDPIANWHNKVNGGEIPEDITNIIDSLAKDTMDEKINAVHNLHHEFYYDCVNVLDWADKKGMDVPKDLRVFIETMRL